MKVFTIFIYCFLFTVFNITHAQYGWFAQNSGTSVNLNSVCNTYPHTYLWAAGNNGTILVTTNGGINWTSQISGTTNNLNSIKFVTPFKGFASGDNGTILRTTDGGLTWVTLSSGTTMNLYFISFDYYVWPDSVYTLYTAGQNGTIVKTTNFGNNWFSQNSGITNDIHAMTIYYYNEVWMAGAGGIILSTMNGGNIWNIVNSGTSLQLNTIQPLYVNGNMFGGLATGNNGTILRSINSGANWSPINSGTNQNLYSTSGQYIYSIWAAGGNGTMVKTPDIGNNWEPDVSNTTNNLNSIIFPDLNSGWAVGDNGTILHTISGNWAVDSRIMDANSISTWYANNAVFNTYLEEGNFTAGFRWPKTQNHFARYSSGLWIGASIGTDTAISVSEYTTDQYVQGYTDNNGNLHGTNDRAYRIYELHYSVNDSDRQQWPNALLGNSDQGAPVYFDTTSNSWKPLDIGDQTMFYTYTDNYPLIHIDYTEPLKVDVKQTNFAFSVQSGALANTIYSQYTIINRNNVTMNNMYIAFWTDDDLGNPFDDKTGCDTIQQIGFTYNGTNYDTAYGSAPPAVSFNLVKGPIVHTGNNNDTAYICKGKIRIAKVGYKQSGMSVFNTYLNGLDPFGSIDYYHYIEGYDLFGNPIINPITGRITKFYYSGDPETNTGWVQTNMDDMRMLISVGPISMNPGDTQIIVMAQVIARGNSNVNSVTLLKQYAQTVRDNYNNCFVNVPISIKNISNLIPAKFNLYQNYPNPFNPTTRIKYDVPDVRGLKLEVRMAIYNILGEKIATLVNGKMQAGSYEVEWNGTKYPSGVYFYRLQITDSKLQIIFKETKRMVLIK